MASKRVRMLSILKVLREIPGIHFEVLENGHEVLISYNHETTLVKSFYGYWCYGNRWIMYPKYPGSNELGDAKHTLWTPWEAKEFADLAEGIANTRAKRPDPR